MDSQNDDKDSRQSFHRMSVRRLAAAILYCLLRQRAIELPILLLATASFYFLAGERTDQA